MHLVKQLTTEPKSIRWKSDILSGIIVALVSIPISMGYSQIAGLPPVYGLYGSLLPILIFGLLTTSPQFVVGVDAMPAVMVGTLLAQMGFAAESNEAMQLAPLMAIFTGMWFMVFFVAKAGRVVKYISTPVMGGFISGIGLTIILMQIPKLFGGAPGTGELTDLVPHIVSQFGSFHLLSFALGLGTVVIILVCKKLIPKIPMTIVMLVVGAGAQMLFHLDTYGVKLLPDVESGLPSFMLPDFSIFADQLGAIVLQSLGIAAVVMAQTLLATGSYAMKYNYKVNNNSELLAYGMMNIAAGVTGACPINGSVSRSGIADSSGCKSQIMSLTAAATMVIVLLFGTPYLKYLPVPILTGIVMTALIGILDFKMVNRLWKTNRNELIIFMISLLAVLLFGTVAGVVIGVLLSFGEVAVRAVNPPASFVGRIPGHGNYHSLDRNSSARAIEGAIIYRFNGNLFFANIDNFITTLEGAIREDTRCVIVDARGISSVDITAIDKMIQFYHNLKSRGVKFYVTEHDGALNDQMRRLGGDKLIESGAVRQTITLALRDAGFTKPYPLVDVDGMVTVHDIKELTEFEWLYGEDATLRMEQMATRVADELVVEEDVQAKEAAILDGYGVNTEWGMLGLFDEGSFLDLLDKRLRSMAESGRISKTLVEDIEKHIAHRREERAKHLEKMDPQLRELIEKHLKRK